jgi:hypothetical protein
LDGANEAAVDELAESFAHSLDNQWHTAYYATCDDRLVTRRVERQRIVQRSLATMSSATAAILSVGNKLYDSALVHSDVVPKIVLRGMCWSTIIVIFLRANLFSQCVDVLLRAFFRCVGMGSGLHSTFRVKGQHTPASTWVIACRLARRGHIVVLLDVLMVIIGCALCVVAFVFVRLGWRLLICMSSHNDDSVGWRYVEEHLSKGLYSNTFVRFTDQLSRGRYTSQWFRLLWLNANVKSTGSNYDRINSK